MTEPLQPEDVIIDNEHSLKKLAWAIEASMGQFKLILARCNYFPLRSQIVESLQPLTHFDIRSLELNKSENTLYARIQKEFGKNQPDALMVFGLESVSDLDQLLTITNQVREEFRKNFHFPLVLWVSDRVLNKMIQLAPDFKSWGISTEFTSTIDELIDFIRQIAENFFKDDLILTLESCQEIKQICLCLKQYEKQVLDLKLIANIESLIGFTEYVSRNLDAALEHYQKGLENWRQIKNFERQGKLLVDIAFCYYLKAIRYREINHQYWQSTKCYLQQCLEVLGQNQCLDVFANSTLRFARILRWLKDWHKWQNLAQKALELHRVENQPIKLAQIYGFLAELALEKEDYKDASKLANKAILLLANNGLKACKTVNIISQKQEVLSKKIENFSDSALDFKSPNLFGIVNELADDPLISYARSLYCFILAQSQKKLDQAQEAIRNLEIAREVGNPEYDTHLYLDILSYLQGLYYEQKNYLKAFEIKLERQSIEQQYGFRAFVGAGRIQPQRKAKLALSQIESQEIVASEIFASGRQLDVNYLVERIGRHDYKLTVIHGQSGVGKSSLVSGGLMPALKQKPIGSQYVLPLLMRVYTDWVGKLGRLLTEVFKEKGIADLPTLLESEEAILEQLRQNEGRKLRTVLIFDQFEEFFFFYPDRVQRREFFEFLGKCLKIPSVKVILSLREDYLHYLLECNRLDSMEVINQDILSKNVLYQLGNFSRDNTRTIIQQLTERSNVHLNSDLIDELVQDLASKLGEVRPIELQIVAAQMETENITTLTLYREYGPKKELVKRYLEGVVKDCGAENEQVAELVLYLLTDEKGTRPLKTRNELEWDLKALAAELTAEANKVDLVLKILVDSGIVLLLREHPDERYQLVHDYLAEFIQKQQRPKLDELILQLEKEREQRQRAEAERQLQEEQLKQVLETVRQMRLLTQFIEAVPVGVVVLDASGKPYYTNRVAEQLLGKGVIAEATSDLFAEIYRHYRAGTDRLYPSEELPIVRALRGENATVDDIEIHRGDKVIPIESWGTPIFDEKGNISYAIIAFQDITERKKSETERFNFIQELFQLNQAFSHFVPRQFLQLLDKESIADVQLGDQVQKEMSVLFSNIRGFTTLSETMTPKENFEFINAYFSRMEPTIIENHGFIDKYIGDTIMALFNGVADDAVKAGISMLKSLGQYNQERIGSGYVPISIGIGINTGSLILGTVGGKDRMDSTVISDAVNVGSLLEGLTKSYGVSLLISEQTLMRLHNPREYSIRFIDRVFVKGKSQPATVFEVFDGDESHIRESKLGTKGIFEEGVSLYYQKAFAKAAQRFEDCLRVNPTDKAAQIYLERCRYPQR